MLKSELWRKEVCKGRSRGNFYVLKFLTLSTNGNGSIWLPWWHRNSLDHVAQMAMDCLRRKGWLGCSQQRGNDGRSTQHSWMAECGASVCFTLSGTSLTPSLLSSRSFFFSFFFLSKSKSYSYSFSIPEYIFPLSPPLSFLFLGERYTSGDLHSVCVALHNFLIKARMRSHVFRAAEGWGHCCCGLMLFTTVHFWDTFYCLN